MKKSRKSFRRKLVENAKNLEIWGLGQFGDLPLTGPTPRILAVHVIALVALRKTVFYSGAIGPNLGEIWNFEIFNITVFEPILAMSLQRTRNDYKLPRAVSAYRPQVQWSSVHLRRSASTPYTQSVGEFGAPLQISMGFASWQRYCTASSSGRRPKFGALNRGRHLCSAGRPSGWALAHILVLTCFTIKVSCSFCHYNVNKYMPYDKEFYKP